jgi:hypothetical protein
MFAFFKIQRETRWVYTRAIDYLANWLRPGSEDTPSEDQTGEDQVVEEAAGWSSPYSNVNLYSPCG